jgi:hypothetical protein
VAWKGSYQSWNFYEGPCNPFSDTPADGFTTTANRAEHFDPRLLETTITLTWNISKGQ